MAKITTTEAVHVSTVIDGKTIEIDLAAGESVVEQAIADLLITQGLASTAGKKSAPAPVADVAPTDTVTTKE